MSVQALFQNIPVAPANPSGNTATAELPEGVAVGTLTDDEMAKVQEQGSLVPASTYAVKASKVDIKTAKEGKDGFEAQPYFNISWKITESGEFAGRVVFERVWWVGKDVLTASRYNGTDPNEVNRRELAREIITGRMGIWKNIAKALGVAVSADPIKVLPNCELKIVLVHGNVREKDESGEYVATGEKEHKITKHLPLIGH